MSWSWFGVPCPGPDWGVTYCSPGQVGWGGYPVLLLVSWYPVLILAEEVGAEGGTLVLVPPPPRTDKLTENVTSHRSSYADCKNRGIIYPLSSLVCYSVSKLN